MASNAEARMNLAALQQRDPYITDIVDTAKQVALYTFSSESNEWEKTEIEGTLFVYSRSANPLNGFMILNRLGLQNLIEPIDRNLEFQLQDPFLLYRNSQLKIYGIWFYDKDECARIGQLMNSLVQLAVNKQGFPRQRRASMGEILPVLSMTNGVDKPVDSDNVDILRLLSKAQEEFNTSTGKQVTEPKPMIGNPLASATVQGVNDLIKPLPLKAHPEKEISALDTLFKNAAISAGHVSSSSPALKRSLSTSHAIASDAGTHQVPHANTTSKKPSPLQRLRSVPGMTLEEIERQQQQQQTPTRLPPSHSHTVGVVLSPASELKKTLNIFPTPQINTAYNQEGNYATSRGGQEGLNPLRLSALSEDKLSEGVNNHIPVYSNVDYSSMNYISTPLVSSVPNLSLDGARCSGVSNMYVTMAATLESPSQVTSAPRRQRLSSTSSTTGSQLVTPADLMRYSEVKNTPSDIPQNLTRKGSEVLITPSMFEISRTASPPVLGLQQTQYSVADNSSQSSSTSDSHISPLTKDQMQQALIYIVKNDPEFLKTLHEAYVKSLNELAIRKQ